MLSPKGDDPTLHLPRILCLHGGGTNARIFRIQCRTLSQQLGRHFRLIYAEAPFATARPGPDVTAVFSKYGPFRQWLLQVDDIEDEDMAFEAGARIHESLADAVAADDLRGATGDVIGLLGFSQGARVAASVLYNQQIRHQQFSSLNTIGLPYFHFAVLLAGRGQLIWLDPDLPMPLGTVSPLTTGVLPLPVDDAPNWNGLARRDRLYLPTIHVHGLNDAGLDLHRKFITRCCLPGSETVVKWHGEHRVPIKSNDVSAVVEQIYRLAKQTGVFTA